MLFIVGGILPIVYLAIRMFRGRKRDEKVAVGGGIRGTHAGHEPVAGIQLFELIQIIEGKAG